MSVKVIKQLKDNRNATSKNIQKTIRLTKDNAKKIKEISKKSNISENEIINGLIEFAL